MRISRSPLWYALSELEPALRSGRSFVRAVLAGETEALHCLFLGCTRPYIRTARRAPGRHTIGEREREREPPRMKWRAATGRRNNNSASYRVRSNFEADTLASDGPINPIVGKSTTYNAPGQA